MVKNLVVLGMLAVIAGFLAVMFVQKGADLPWISDAGKPCTDNSQCQSLTCIPPNTAVSGSKTVGRCYRGRYSGCTPVVVQGVVQANCPD